MDLLEYPFDASQILSRKKSIRKELLQKNGLTEKRIAILSGTTVGVIQDILEIFLLSHGIKPFFLVGGYNQFYQDAVFGNAELDEFAPELIYINTSNKNILEFPDVGDDSDVVGNLLERTYQSFESVWTSLQNKYHCPIIQNNLEALPYRLMGNADVYQQSGHLRFLNQLNERFYQHAQKTDGLYINDINYLASWYGLEQWSEPSFWYLYKYALNLDAIPLLCSSIANIIKSIFGKNKKAVALDLDNTLWGGVIGDDGVDHIKLGTESPEGMPFSDFQAYLKQLSGLGVLLTVCSKNEEQIADTGFTHSSSILSKDDFVCYKANWQDKHLNIEQIAKELNILGDSIVFVDDNPAEQDIVTMNLPQVPVLKVKRPDDFIKFLDHSSFFEVTALSEDDKKRNQFYKDNRKRSAEQSSFSDRSSYLKALDMHCIFQPVCDANLSRVTQLINKTNQFNLTTRRYTEEELRAVALSPDTITITAKLIDKYGDNGITSVLICKVNQTSAEISLWVMSCRVFKRDLELAVFDALVAECVKRNVSYLTGCYLPTEKNKLVKGFYGEIGFHLVEENDKIGKWEYHIPQDYQNKNTVMKVEYHHE